jgi:hypothetical protein
MSEAAPTSDPHQPGRTGRQSTDGGRRRGRLLIPGVVLAVILGIFAVLLLVTRCGSGADEVSQGNDSGSAEGTVVMDTGSPLPL